MVQRPMQMCPKCSQNNTLTARSCIHCGSPLSSVPLLAKNTVLNNRYTVFQVLGFGGFGAVYLAFDQRLNNRKVAVKELLQTDPFVSSQIPPPSPRYNCPHNNAQNALKWWQIGQNWWDLGWGWQVICDLFLQFKHMGASQGANIGVWS
mgnify:CR=1 FL=1